MPSIGKRVTRWIHGNRYIVGPHRQNTEGSDSFFVPQGRQKTDNLL
jgi:hypothetical protein